MSWQRAGRPVAVSSLDAHPNVAEILGILNRMQRLSDREIVKLARGWRDTAYLALARDRALDPDAPLVIDVLSAFDRVDETFHEELHDFSTDRSAAVKPHIVNTALKAVRDALAAAYAQPVLARGQYLALMAPWRRVIAS